MIIQFLRNELFSSIEFLTLIIFTLSLFRHKIRYYKMEIIGSALSMSALSYFLIKLNLSSIFIIIQIIVLIILYRYLFYMSKWWQAIVSCLIGYFLYAAVQYGLAMICVYVGYQTMSDLTIPFTLKGEILSTLTAVVIVTISTYLRITNEGYSFNLTSLTKSKSIMLSTIGSMIMIIGIFDSFKHTTSISSYYILATALLLASYLILYMSNKHETLTYTDN